MITKGAPETMMPPCAVISPIRAAGLPPIKTVADPFTMTSMGPTQMHLSPILAAGMPEIMTVGQHGGIIGPPTWGTTPVTIGQVCMSVIRDAGGIGGPDPAVGLLGSKLAARSGHVNGLGADAGNRFPKFVIRLNSHF
jgi:hypothetical protein